jgi:putative sigma-54 modulation protein
MIKNIIINPIHVDLDDNLKKYINKKIGRLDKYLGSDLKDKLTAEIYLKELKSKDKNNCRFEVNLIFPNEKITAEESTLNMYAAVDIVEEKLKHQLIKYHQKHHSAKFYRHLINKFRKKNINSINN